MTTTRSSMDSTWQRRRCISAVCVALLPGASSFSTVAKLSRSSMRPSRSSAQRSTIVSTTKLFAINNDIHLHEINDSIDELSLKDETSDQKTSPSETDRQLEIPSVRTILKFALPATGIYLCNPLLSMIDTSTVGLLAGTSQQAALNPAVSLTEYSGRLMSFLYTGTTSIMAASRTKDRETSKAGMIGALQLSLLVGGALGFVLFVFTKPILYYMIGNDAIGAEIFDSATRYVRIRALGMPAAALIGSAQAACLGLQDVRSPLRIISIAAIINLIADVMLVGSSNRWIGGAAGASWATTIAQYAAAGLFVKWLWTPANDESSEIKARSRLGKKYDSIKTRFRGGQSVQTKNKSERSMSTRGFLADKPFPSSLSHAPSESTRDGYRPFVLPVTMTQIGRCAVYVAMGHAVSSCFGTTSMAAQQIICSVFYTLIPIADSLSLTAQSFLPSIFQQEPSVKRSRAMRQTSWNLAKAAALFGVVLSSIAGLLPIGVRLFTTDATVTALVNSIVPILMAVFLFHGIFCGSEGILLAQKDLTFLGRMYGAYFVVVPYLMLRVKRASLMGKHVQLKSVWNVFLGYQAFRITAWVVRVIWLQRNSDREALKVSSQNNSDLNKMDDDNNTSSTSACIS